MKLKRFNESEEFEQDQELPKEQQPLFSMNELEAAFLSARVKSLNGKPGFPTFKDWYLSELDHKVDMRDNPFDMHTRFPFAKPHKDDFR